MLCLPSVGVWSRTHRRTGTRERSVRPYGRRLRRTRDVDANAELATPSIRNVSLTSSSGEGIASEDWSFADPHETSEPRPQFALGVRRRKHRYNRLNVRFPTILITPMPLSCSLALPHPARANFGLKRAQLLLEPRSVQAALSRRRGGNRLTKDERDWIRRCTRDPDSLRWPRGTDK